MKLITNILNTPGISQPMLKGYIGLSWQALIKAGNRFISLGIATLIKRCHLQQFIERAAGSEKQYALSANMSKAGAEREIVLPASHELQTQDSTAVTAGCIKFLNKIKCNQCGCILFSAENLCNLLLSSTRQLNTCHFIHFPQTSTHQSFFGKNGRFRK